MILIICSAAILLGLSFLVFRRLIRRDYLKFGHLTGISSLSELIVFAGIMGFPYLFHPPQWSYFWKLDGPSGFALHFTGLLIVIIGFVLAFVTMGWFGFKRAMGLEAEGLISRGPYRFSRNPQIIGGYLLVIGISVQWPSWFCLVWIAIYGISGHWMILTEEEHLRILRGEEYVLYCEKIPRYLFVKSRRKQRR